MMNNEKIMNNLKKKIAIQNFEESSTISSTENVKERKGISLKKRLLAIAGTLCFTVVVVGLSSNLYAKRMWEIGFKEYNNRHYETGYSKVEENEVNMDYVYCNNIGAKVSYVELKEDHLFVEVDMIFPENMEINTSGLSFNYAAYDENKNVYGVFERMILDESKERDTYTPYMYEEIGIEYNKNDIYAIQLAQQTGIANIEAKDHVVTTKLEFKPKEKFPDSEKLYVRVMNLGFDMVERIGDPNKDGRIEYENFDIPDVEWIFEIDIPQNK